MANNHLHCLALPVLLFDSILQHLVRGEREGEEEDRDLKEQMRGGIDGRGGGGVKREEEGREELREGRWKVEREGERRGGEGEERGGLRGKGRRG